VAVAVLGSGAVVVVVVAAAAATTWHGLCWEFDDDVEA
jgi:hypothetical protein